jgi:mannose-1-phosphate guanylyltransferase
MAPLTNKTPKPMLDVAGIAFTEHQIRKAAAAGIKEIVLATSYMAEIFQPHFGDGRDFGLEIGYAVEEVALGTGGAIGNAAKQLKYDGQVAIFNGDVLSSHDLLAQAELHSKKQAAVTLYLTQVPDARAFGVVELDEAGRVLTFREKMEEPPTNLINAGCYIFDPNVFAAIAQGQVVSIERETFPLLLAAGELVMGFVDHGYWLDIGRPAALAKATADLITGQASTEAFSRSLANHLALISNGAGWDHTAQIAGDAEVLAGSFIGAGSIIANEVKLSGSIIGRNAIIGARSQLQDCFVYDGYEIPAGTLATGAFFGFGDSAP